MSDTDHIAPEDEGRVAAAEYVLGVLPAAERPALEERIAREPALAREIAYWEERLGGLADTIKPVAPPAQSWLRIEAALSAPATAPMAPRATSLWDSLAFWRGFGIGTAALATAAIAAFAYVAILAPAQQQQAQTRAPMLATLSGVKTNQPNFVAAIGADGQSLTIVPAALLTADKRSMELWLIPQGGTPHSLGLIAAGQPVRLNLPKELMGKVAGATLAVSLEPPGGSPTGQPTGEVIAHGSLGDL
jgi:anti-sigma-K factor RskA